MLCVGWFQWLMYPDVSRTVQRWDVAKCPCSMSLTVQKSKTTLKWMGLHIGSRDLAHNAPFSHFLLSCGTALKRRPRMEGLRRTESVRLRVSADSPLECAFPHNHPPSLRWTAGENLTMRDDNRMPKHAGDQMSCEWEQSSEFARWRQAPGRVSPQSKRSAQTRKCLSLSPWDCRWSGLTWDSPSSYVFFCYWPWLI